MAIRILLILLLAMWVVLGAAFSTAELAGSRGVPHEELGAMLQGGPPSPSRVVFLGWCFGVLQICLFITCMCLGISRNRRDDGPSSGRTWLYVLFGAGSVAYLGIFSRLVWANWTATSTGSVTFLGSFPEATTWMLYGMWAAPLLFVVAYVVGVSRWIITDDDLQRFEELVSRSSESQPRA